MITQSLSRECVLIASPNSAALSTATTSMALTVSRLSARSMVVTSVTRAPIRQAVSARAYPACRGSIGQYAHRIDGFARPAGTHQHSRARQRTAISLNDPVHQFDDSHRLKRDGRFLRPRRPDDQSRARVPAHHVGAASPGSLVPKVVSHISVCIAGHNSTGARVASKVAVKRSSAQAHRVTSDEMPVAGATMTSEAPEPKYV